MTEGTGKNIYQRLNAVLADIEPLQKDGYNEAQKYAFISQATIVATVRPLLVKHGIVIVPTIVGSETQPNASGKGVFNSIQINFEVINIDDPSDRFLVLWSAEASDFSDKALNKSLTAALKTLLKQLLFISDVDPDAEQGDAPTQATRQQPQPNRYSNAQPNRYENTTTVRQVTPSRPVPTFDPIPEDRPKVTKDDLINRIKPWYDRWSKTARQAETEQGRGWATIQGYDNARITSTGMLLKARVEYAEALVASGTYKQLDDTIIADIQQLTREQLEAELKKIALKSEARP